MAYRGDRTTGFASPAADSVESTIDLMSAVLDLRRPSRYPVCVEGDVLTARGIRHGDILVVDSALPLRRGPSWLLRLGASFACVSLRNMLEHGGYALQSWKPACKWMKRPTFQYGV
ncbi:S24 family peptidase [Neokomagataea tanensis]|uniref:S24 family peptidase n=1 Tax=Neokomagataea tanensis TaxID=661191 RepID=UPI001F10F062|nr:S24 family peptidase [Neokomagataea tanensis]